MRIATWNVNSLNARIERVDEWLDYASPDVLLLQETKMGQEQFPHDHYLQRGYESVHSGEGRWNGVAILSKVGMKESFIGFADGGEEDAEARIISSTCGGVRVSSVYVPNGREVDHDHYHYKMSWMSRLTNHLKATCEPSDPVVVGGDYNICPDDRDVWDPDNEVPRTHVTQDERDAIAALQDWGLVDVFREVYEDEGLFSWWDYRDGAFHKKMGLRIDLLMVSRSIADRATFCLVDRTARKGKRPSDHAPVFVDINP